MTDDPEAVRETILPPLPDTFMGHHLAGRDPGDIDDWIDRWHESTSDLQLHQFLGLTWEEYGNLVLSSKCLPHIIATRRLVETGRAHLLGMVARHATRLN